MRKFLIVALVAFTLAAGCLGNKANGDGNQNAEQPPVEEPATFVLSVVGQRGPEPSIGITSSGCMFFMALKNVMRSCDKGETWKAVQDIFSQDGTSDPYGWVDPVTDRIFNVQMLSLVCTWIAWSDDDGESWLGNPLDCGTIPVNDHIKLATGPWVGAESPLSQNPIYSQAVYFCMNKLAAVECCTSIDGGATFSLCVIAGSGGLHGAVSTAPDGTVFVPPRTATPSVHYSKDNGLTWRTVSMGSDVGTPSPRKNSEIAADTKSNIYHTWVGKDMRVYLSRSLDGAATWDQKSLPVSPPEVISTTFPHIAAGDPGRIALAYLGSENAEKLGTPDIDNKSWDGNPHYAPAGVHYHLYVTYSLNALDAEPKWTTVKVTDDPVQVGSICISSGDCRNIGGSNRNLLDFNDLHIDREGRVYVAFADGCTGDCATMADAQPKDSRSGMGTVAILAKGPSLYADMADFTGY